MSLFNDDNSLKRRVTFSQGHYTLDKIKNEIKSAFKRDGEPLSTEINTAVGQLVIFNWGFKKIQLD